MADPTPDDGGPVTTTTDPAALAAELRPLLASFDAERDKPDDGNGADDLLDASGALYEWFCDNRHAVAAALDAHAARPVQPLGPSEQLSRLRDAAHWLAAHAPGEPVPEWVDAAVNGPVPADPRPVCGRTADGVEVRMGDAVCGMTKPGGPVETRHAGPGGRAYNSNGGWDVLGFDWYSTPERARGYADWRAAAFGTTHAPRAADAPPAPDYVLWAHGPKGVTE